MIKELIRLASHLDLKGFTREADYLDNIIKRASPFDDSLEMPSSKAQAKDYATRADAELKDVKDDFDRIDVLSKYQITNVQTVFGNKAGKCKVSFNSKDGLMEIVEDVAMFPNLCKQ